MQSVGQVLREERLRQSLTLEEVSASTRISLKNLDAIEKDDFNQIGAPFFYKSFVRQRVSSGNLPAGSGWTFQPFRPPWRVPRAVCLGRLYRERTVLGYPGSQRFGHRGGVISDGFLRSRRW
jgi:hypothetical protein